MKKHLGSAFFVLVAICLAFTDQLDADGPNCKASLYWFKVKSSQSWPCGLIIQSDLELVPDINLNGLPDEVWVGTIASAPYGCLDENDEACALGYTYNANPAVSQLERVLIGGSFYWRPKSTAVSSYSCCVKRPEGL